MNVLLFANVGSADNGFYHAGDEAMFYETYRYYQNNFPAIKLTALVSSVSHQKLKIKEGLNLSWPENGFKSRLYFIFLSLKVIIWKVTGLSILSAKELRFVSIIKRQQLIHFTGAGNINSLFPNWLYYSFFIIFLGWFFNKKVILTSQTIGPIGFFDRIFSILILNLPALIILREKIKEKNPLLKYGILKPIVKGGLDAAYTLPINSKYILPGKKCLRIGLSLHPWKNYEEILIKSVVLTLNKFAETTKIEVLLIPHIITKENDEWDILYMKKLKTLLNKQINIMEPKYEDIIESAIESAITIKWLTSKVDLLITSRYHGIVFAASSNVPFLTFKMNEYYTRKNSKIVEMLFGRPEKEYLIDLNKSVDDISLEILTKIKYIINYMDEEKNKLKKINSNLANQSFISNKYLYSFIKNSSRVE